MKSIDEGFNDHKSKNQTLFRTSKVSFNAGIEFAERWIPVEEELPGQDFNKQLPNWSYPVLCKCQEFKHGIDISSYNFYTKKWYYQGESITVTHWRPINHI